MFYLKRFRRYGFLLNAGFIAGLWSLGSGALWFLLPSVINEITDNLAILGVLIAIPGVLAFIVDIPIGDLADKIGRRKVVYAGLTALTLIGLSMHVIESLTTLLLFLIILGVSYPAVFVPLIAYVMDYTPREKSSTFMGAELSMIQLGFGVGPLIAGLSMHLIGLSAQTVLAIIYSTSCMLALMFAIFIFKEEPEYHGVLDGIKDVILKDRVYLKELSDFKHLKNSGITILVTTLILSIYDGAIWTLEPLFYKTVTNNPLWGGLILSCFVIPLILFEVPAGILADKYNRKILLYIGMLVAAVMTFLFSIASSPYVMLVTAFLASTGIALSWPALEGIMATIAPIHQRGQTVGMWGLSRDLGYVIGPLFAGIIASQTSISFTFKILAVILAFAGIIGLISCFLPKNLFKKKIKKKKEPFKGRGFPRRFQDTE